MTLPAQQPPAWQDAPTLAHIRIEEGTAGFSTRMRARRLRWDARFSWGQRAARRSHHAVLALGSWLARGHPRGGRTWTAVRSRSWLARRHTCSQAWAFRDTIRIVIACGMVFTVHCESVGWLIAICASPTTAVLHLRNVSSFHHYSRQALPIEAGWRCDARSAAPRRREA